MRHLLIILLLTWIKSDFIYPENQDTLYTTHVLFEWNQEPQADLYNLQLSNSENFDELLLDYTTSRLINVEKALIDWNSQYYARIKPIFNNQESGSWSNTLSFLIGDSIFENGAINVSNDPNYSNDHLIAVGYYFDEHSIIFDFNGNEIWNEGSTAFKLINVDKYGRFFGKNQDNNKGNELTYHHQIVDRTQANLANQHELFKMPNGNYMYLKNVTQQGPIPIGPWTSMFQSLGYIADGVTNEFPWRGQEIIEANPVTREEVWNWNAFDYISMEDYDSLGGSWLSAFQQNEFDWTHANSIFFDEQESALYLSIRQLSKIVKIDYPSGDILWMIGLPEEFTSGNTNQNICTNLLFSFQHHVSKLDNGNLLMFDNGNISDIVRNLDNKLSRALEFEINDNNECNIVWEYDLPENYYAKTMGSTQHLSNDNYLINTNVPGEGHVLEVNPNYEILFDASLVLDKNYRSYSIPSLYPEAFYVIFDSLKIININDTEVPGLMISEEDDYSINFEIFNQGGYDLNYQYSLNDDQIWFGYAGVGYWNTLVWGNGSFNLPSCSND